MVKFSKRFIRLIFGLFLYALGIVMTINANIGYAPWDVFHVGLANSVGLSIGVASILTGVVIVFISWLLGEKLGLGTILNMLLIGVFLDMIMALKVIPKLDHVVLGIFMMIGGLFVIALASYFYIGAAFGAGPRDSLMVALTRKTGLSVGICRGSIELMAVVIGWRMGGKLGLGTILSALAIGFCVQMTFKWLKFDATSVRHETLDKTFRWKADEPT